MRLAQPDQRSCGAACLVMARRAAAADYAELVCDQATFSREVLQIHRRLTSLVDSAGSIQLPWLRAIGTPPWAAARELRLITGTDYASKPAPRRVDVWRHVREATPARPVAVYVGDRWAPRHVVLALDASAQGVWTYEPVAGHVTLISKERWKNGPLRLAGWERPWLVVAPVSPSGQQPSRRSHQSGVTGLDHLVDDGEALIEGQER